MRCFLFLALGVAVVLGADHAPEFPVHWGKAPTDMLVGGKCAPLTREPHLVGKIAHPRISAPARVPPLPAAVCGGVHGDSRGSSG